MVTKLLEEYRKTAKQLFEDLNYILEKSNENDSYIQLVSEKINRNILVNFVEKLEVEKDRNDLKSFDNPFHIIPELDFSWTYNHLKDIIKKIKSLIN